MTKKKTKRDDVVGLVKCLKIRHSPKGPITTVPMEVELARIDRTAPVQFREQLYEETIERQEAVLENGGQPDRLHLVEAVIEDGPEGRSVRAVRDREQDEISYLTADSWHRIEATERHHRKLCEEATLPGSAHGNLDPPRIRAEVIRGAKDPLAVATEVSIRITMGHQTPVSDSERIRGVYTLKDLNPEMSNHEIGDAVGYSHVHVARLLAQRKITQALQKAGTQVPANKALLEEMANVPEKALPELAKLLAFEKWSSESLRQANSRATRISEANWDGLKDYRGEPSWAPRTWELISEVECLRLAHAANKEGWTDEQLIWGAKYVYDLHGSEDKDEKREYREMLAGHLDPDSWMAEAEGWKELEPITWEPAPPAPEPKVEPQPAPAGSGSAGPAEGTPAPVVTANRKEQVQSPAASEGMKAEEGAAPRSAGSGSAAATQTEVGVMAPCRILIEDMRSSVGKLKERRPVLATLATPEDRAALRAIAKVLADLERSLRLLNA